MNKNTAVIVVKNLKTEVFEDLEVPLNITANDLVIAFNSIYHLNINIDDVLSCYLKSENPIALLKGNKTLEEYGIRNGSIVIINE